MSPAVLIPALRTVGNIVTGDDNQTQVIINCTALPCLLTSYIGATTVVNNVCHKPTATPVKLCLDHYQNEGRFGVNQLTTPAAHLHTP